MPSTRSLRRTAFVLAAAAMCLLSACSPVAPSMTAPTTSAATTAATTEPVGNDAPPVDAPSPRFAIGCDAVLPRTALVALLGAGEAPLGEVDLGAVSAPDASAAAQVGALECAWNDGRVGSTWTGPVEGAQSVRLGIVPDAQEAAQAYADLYNGGETPTPYGATAQGPRCVAFDVDAFCELHGWLAEAWIALQIDGIVLEEGDTEASLAAEFTALTDAMIAALADVGSSSEPWMPPASTRSVEECEQLTTPAELTEVTGLPDLRFGLSWDGPRVGQYWYSVQETGAMRCSIGFSQSESGYGTVSYLPGGDWRYLLERDAWIADGGAFVDVPGLDSEAAVLRCADDSQPCMLDLRLDRGWVRISFPEVPPASVTYLPEGLDFVAARSSIVELASRIVANAG
ncbi:hypothetical protein [Agromyces sp. NPDC058110]|uniref:hypothetical protein n=1 Tax=Agromyces sp. NPDC058110 TaxID=3346345 RepID=UPI0036D8770C